jgi:hypothetical protein
MTDQDDIQRALAETWQKIPEEERGGLLAQAKAQGVEACFICALIGCALAISLQAQWIALTAFAFIPLLYQVVSTRVWLETKPLTTLKYFIAAATSKMYAQHLQSSDPALKLIFRGSLEAVPPEDQNALDPEFVEEVQEQQPQPKDVWISLFPDALVMIAEGTEGATLEFAHSTLRDFQIALDSPESDDGSPTPSRLLIQTTANEMVESRWVLSSPHTASLLACERKIRYFNQRAAESAA